jgi:flagellar protein FliO/FliZ
MLVSLGMVVSLFLIAALMIRKSQPKQYQKLPKEVVEVLGRSPLGPRQNLVLLRFGSKLILVSQQPGETQSLGEIADAGEAARLVGLCEVQRPESVTGSFRDILRQVVQAQPNTARASHRPIA